MAELIQRLRDLDSHGHLRLPLPGSGETAKRHAALADLGREDLSLGRIAEAHTDAIAILAEAGRDPSVKGIYGVWASDGPHSRVEAHRSADGAWRLRGVKQYCSGAAFLDAVLVSAHGQEGLLLFEVPLTLAGISVRPATWRSPALADTTTAPVEFNEVSVSADALVGTPNWYLDRPGFWHGAIGPAACWAGGAQSLVDAATALSRQDPHSRAQVGALQSISWGLTALLQECGHQIDRDPTDSGKMARKRALMLRHLVERWCTETLDRFGRASGPQLLAFDETAIRQYGSLTVYIRQCHAERDLATVPD